MSNPFLAKKSRRIPASALLMILLFAGAVLAGYIYSSNIVKVTVQENYALTLEPENQTVLYYEIVNFTATLTKIPNGGPVAGANISLLLLDGENKIVIDWNITDSNGVTTLHWNATEVGTFEFQAYWDSSTYSQPPP